MNKKTIIALVSASLAAPMSALAADNYQGHFYGRVDVGYGMEKHKDSRTDTIKNTVLNITQTGTASSNKNGNGVLGSVAMGYFASKEFRTELQFYVDNGFKSKASNYTLGNTTYSLKGKEKTMAVFANLFYDFRNSTPVTPYIMGGVGYANNKAHVGELKFKKKNGFAYQLGLGASYQVARNFDFDIGYRLMQKDSKRHSVTTTDSAGNTHSATMKKSFTNSILFGVRFAV